MVVKLTQKQADYIESFRKDAEQKHVFSTSNDVKQGEEMPVWASVAVKNLSRIGFGYGSTDYNDNEIEFGEGFEHENIPTLIDAVINGYEAEKPKFKFYNFVIGQGLQKFWYAGNKQELTPSESYAIHVEKDSEAYDALRALGFIRKQVNDNEF